MKNVAFIPVRGGSKSIPMKNVKLFCGKPLVYWTIKAACECYLIDLVYVSTDSDYIKSVVSHFISENEITSCNKIKIIARSKESASDMASTESALLEFAELVEFDNVALIQATSPLMQSSDLSRGFEVFEEEGTDSVISVVRQKRFNWRIDETGFVHPINYDPYNRPRRQEFEGYLVENGAYYINTRKNILETKNRLSGKIKAVEMSGDSFFEIDEPNDWMIMEMLMRKRLAKGLDQISKI